MALVRPLDLGAMRHSVLIQQKTVVRDPHGGYSASTWATVSTVFASIEPLSGNEYVQHNQLQAGATHRIRIWYSSDVSSIAVKDWKIVFGSREFDIKSLVNPREENEMIEIMAREKL